MENMPAVSVSKYRVQAGWDDAPHLDAQAKDEMLASTPPHLRDARARGTPSLGSGAIYPVVQASYLVDPFAIPPHWRKAYGLDVGWNCTACIWGALDADSDVLYLYSEHYQGQQKPVDHAAAIKARGEWIPGVIDPAARGRSQDDGERLFVQYRELGLNIFPANNSVESGIYEVWQRLEQGRLKVFSTLRHWLAEARLYRRDEHGKIVKKDDHAMDASRYLIVSGIRRAIPRPVNDNSSTDRIVADGLGGY
jgi:hypothetical protein